MKETLSQFWIFLKKPTLLKLSRDKNSLKKDFLWLLVIDIIFAIFIALIFMFLIEFKLIKEYKTQDLLKEYGVLTSFIFACICAPLLEEFIFRWHLRKRYATIYFVFLSVAGIIIYFIDASWINFLVFLISFIIAALIISYYVKQSQTKKHILWKRLYPIVFYFSALIFGFVHLSNFQGLTIQDPAFIIYMSSQTFGGLSLGYLRVKYGLMYSILSHSCFNLIALILTILFPNF